MNPSAKAAQQIAHPLKVVRTGGHISLVDASGRVIIRKVVSSLTLEQFNQLHADLLALSEAVRPYEALMADVENFLAAHPRYADEEMAKSLAALSQPKGGEKV